MVLGRERTANHLEPTLPSNEETTCGRQRSEAPSYGRPTCAYGQMASPSVWKLLGRSQDRYSPFGGLLDPRECIWFAERMSPWIDDVFILLSRCVSSSFPWLSNLHTNIHQHFVEFVTNNSYH